VVHEERQKDDDGKWNSDQPEKRTATKTHVNLHCVFRWVNNSASWGKFHENFGGLRRQKIKPRAGSAGQFSDGLAKTRPDGQSGRDITRVMREQ
jgi:hypothetical protein